MAALEATMKKHNINLDLFAKSTFQGHALCAFGFSFNASSSSSSYFSSNKWLIDYGASYHMAIDKSIFTALNECNTK